MDPCSPQGWAVITGSPQINSHFNVTLPPFAPGINFASMFASALNLPTTVYQSGEGLVMKIPPVTATQLYTLSLFRRFASTFNNPSIQLDEFTITMMHCEDYIAMISNGDISAPPVHSQPIYCESNISSTNWEQTSARFTPDEDYDMVWFQPRHTVIVNTTQQAWIDIALPELISNNLFMATITESLSGCSTTLRPSCTLRDAAYRWDGPNNQILTTEVIILDTNNPINIGIWTLTMGLPTHAEPINTCTQNFAPIITTVSVQGCKCIKLPKIKIE